MDSSFIDIIWDADLADMQLISKYNKGFSFLLCVIDIYSRYVYIVPLIVKTSITIIELFKKKFDESNRKSNEIWVDKVREVCNRSTTS